MRYIHFKFISNCLTYHTRMYYKNVGLGLVMQKRVRAKQMLAKYFRITEMQVY